ncbi:ATP-binding protein [Jidongwangia harbinensis]|uniref:ATP-binding protein n=1 Tax=Jidongwangia harbinensis TaxID=2878561 RepID=UPI001CD9CC81|nr:ATP-binding protein [Jidongwangia harbinensis]MCA2213860.1 ATP-binding protein [Jidongwangia harbinensis]
MRVSPPPVFGEGPITAERAAENALAQLAADIRSDRRPLVLHLPSAPESASLARNLVGDACWRWNRPDLLHPARLMMSELVSNAVEHAGSEITVVVSRHGDGLHLAVSDGQPRLPRLRRPSAPHRGRPLDERGFGLRTIQAVATDWGAAATPTGKVVWASLR